jgi:hypothetical protein
VRDVRQINYLEEARFCFSLAEYCFLVGDAEWGLWWARLAAHAGGICARIY